MKRHARSDRQIFGIIVYGLSLAFGGVIASLATIRATPNGFTLDMSRWTLVALALGTAAMVPCFRIIFYSENKPLRRIALSAVVTIGAAGFLYLIRFIPIEKRRDILVGLVSAVLALSGIAGLLFLSHRFLEADTKASKDSGNP